MERPSLDEYFMEIARVVASRSTCLRHQVGAVLVREKRILSTGYNGAPTGLPHCLEAGCRRENVESGFRHELCRAVHAEQNAIIQAAIHGVSTSGATLYCTHQPCILCAKIIINSQIKRVVYGNPYPDDEALRFLEQAGVEVAMIPSPATSEGPGRDLASGKP
ncbi:MAG: cytidine/deoxycytidylate deaminase family protein [Methanothrix sp.]|nr:cytidine/deoxycytidylate deaminase family protein [Methanothrix sp.]NLX39296.1 cytidine deaminase [Methanothrix sp.]HNT71495.1 cytidine/deoxycytidylate deaminase family protein [Methanothrix sp.]HQA62669.1 cytidine/deoxycytidylate deaminase family protein [Methanothrix sp.]